MRSRDGLQPWSVGPIYPWMIRGLGHSLQAFNGITGEAGPCYEYDFDVEGSFKAAYQAATDDCQAALEGTAMGKAAPQLSTDLECVAA